MIVLLIAAFGALVAGALAMLYGVSYKEFSLGNTVLLAGVMSVCTGLILFGMWIAIREMRTIARRIASPASAGMHEPSLPELGAAPAKTQFPSRSQADSVSPPSKPEPPSFPPFSQAEIEDRPTAPDTQAPDIAPTAAAEPAPEPKPKPRRNLLFESSVRKDRERAAVTNGSGGAAPAIETGQRTFDDPIAQRGADRADRLQRSRSPSTFAEPKAAATPDVTVLKSGVVDGMAYSLYSDGSIEAQMPEGMMRFASIEELRAHLDQRT